jgi:hypothetical protein
MAYQNMNANWHPGEMAFQNYLRGSLNKQIGNGGCIIYPSVARAQQVLDIWKQEQQKKGGTPYIVETGWMYTAAPRRGGIGK